jgi:hypothetical protein
MPMFPDYIEEMYKERFGLKIFLNAKARYRILKRDDSDTQGLQKSAQIVCLYKRGMTMLMKEEVRANDAMLVEIDIDEPELKTTMKSCCGILNCEKSETIPGFYEVDVEFLFLKDKDKDYIDSLIVSRLKTAV